MKRLIIYYSLSGNTKDAAEKLSKKIEADVVSVETVKTMPKKFALQILVGGGQVAMGYIPKLKPLALNPAEYDEIILGFPIWNAKCVPAIKALLKNEEVAKKVKGAFIFSGSGVLDKCLADLEGKLPYLKNTVSLIDKKVESESDNDDKLAEFANAVLG